MLAEKSLHCLTIGSNKPKPQLWCSFLIFKKAIFNWIFVTFVNRKIATKCDFQTDHFEIVLLCSNILKHIFFFIFQERRSLLRSAATSATPWPTSTARSSATSARSRWRHTTSSPTGTWEMHWVKHFGVTHKWHHTCFEFMTLLPRFNVVKIMQCRHIILYPLPHKIWRHKNSLS